MYEERVLVLHSGGMDSTVLLCYLRDGLGMEVESLGVNYGQKHLKELSYAADYCKMLGVRRDVVDLTSITRFLSEGGSSLVSQAQVPDGHYSEESMKQTIVPNRNMMLLSIAGAVAISRGIRKIAIAAHDGDHAIYPDCRQEFVNKMNDALKICDWNGVEIISPFIGQSKADIVLCGIGHGVNFEMTWSCYKGGDIHCGTCGTCTERREAFEIASNVTKYGSDHDVKYSSMERKW